MPSLEFNEVWKQYGSGLTVLRGVSFALSKSEIVFLVGENGAGKTTTFDIVCGRRRADSGSVCVHGRPIHGRSQQALAKIGVRRMYQFPTVFRTLSIRDNILLGVHPELYSAFRPWPFNKMRDSLWQQICENARPLLKSCPFLQDGRASTATLSFGQQRILDFIRVLSTSNQTTLLLLDEPFAGIASDVVEIMWNMIQDAASIGATVLLVEHENESARFQGFRRLRLLEGKVQ